MAKISLNRWLSMVCIKKQPSASTKPLNHSAKSSLERESKFLGLGVWTVSLPAARSLLPPDLIPLLCLRNGDGKAQLCLRAGYKGSLGLSLFNAVDFSVQGIFKVNKGLHKEK